MEQDFFDLYAAQSQLAVEVGHNSTADWAIRIYDRENKPLGDWGAPVVQVQHCNRKLAFADAYVKLAEYLSETRGGY